jgi:hypothetical protein
VAGLAPRTQFAQHATGKRTGQYTQNVRFDWFVNGVYDGYQTVQRIFLPSNDDARISGAVTSTRYSADDTPRAQLCGSATSTRVL